MSEVLKRLELLELAPSLSDAGSIKVTDEISQINEPCNRCDGSSG